MSADTATRTNVRRREFLGSIVNTLDILRVFDEGVIITDATGRIMFYNTTQERIDGAVAGDILGKRTVEVYDLTQETSLIMRCLHSGGPLINQHLVYRTRAGRLANTLCSVFPLFAEEGLAGAVCFVRDYNLVENTITSICSPAQREPKPAEAGGRFTFDHLIGVAPTFRVSVKTAKMAALTPSPVMLQGETGTGKELFAQAMHHYGPRSGEHFVALNCAAIPENLLEGMLFGTVRGAFTGAVDKPGLFEKASGGTLFLDEINSMPVGLQAKLLRVVQERSVRRVGSLEERAVDVKILSSVNEDPHAVIAQGRLRMDLFYRLGVVLLRIPPLRERPEDVAVLTRHFIEKHNARLGRQVVRVAPQVEALFRQHGWPGNVRELEHVLEGAMNVMGERGTIELGDLPPHLGVGRRSQAEPVATSWAGAEVDPRGAVPDHQTVLPSGAEGGGLKGEQEELERRAIGAALTATRGNVAAAARQLGISRQLLRYKMGKHGIERGDFCP